MERRGGEAAAEIESFTYKEAAAWRRLCNSNKPGCCALGGDNRILKKAALSVCLFISAAAAAPSPLSIEFYGK